MIAKNQDATLLPPDAVDRLKAAGRIEPLKPRGQSAVRNRAIDATVKYIKTQYPELFKEEN